ncbi:hypothetical protein EXH44_05640 [Actinobacillus indolicus]|uniref:Uncharacterized protein n=1 Tax=Actinobacillus indolicus TaxID=51049 RepID=A0A4P7CKF3_9PAST|nr:hypothetical protein [Actinobacillus indolicus]QBQ63751.1 hypothetical protein EXH44_05640 [Actinobacillus indolicus]
MYLSIKAKLYLINNKVETHQEFINLLEKHNYFFETLEKEELKNNRGIRQILIFTKTFDISHRNNLDYEARKELSQILPMLEPDQIIVEDIEKN